MQQRAALYFVCQVLFVAICFSQLPTALHAQEEITRVWTSGKATKELAYVAHDKKKVTLRYIEGNSKGKTVDFPVEKLSDADRKFLAGLAIIRVDKEQHETVMPYMARYTESPLAVTAILEQIADDQPDSPYAFMMAGRTGIYTSNMMDDGIGGGPCFDVNGNMIGLAFAKSDFRHGRFIWFNNMRLRRTHYDHAVAVSSDSIIDFLKIAKPEFEFPVESNQPYDSRQQLVETVRSSVLLAKSWQAGKDKIHEVRPDYVPDDSRESWAAKRERSTVNLASIRKKRLFPDLWCMTLQRLWRGALS